MSRPSVAVLLAAYNGIQWIEEQVQSILAQVYVDIHIYISVDLSTDGTFEWCVQFAETNENVSVLPLEERFGGAAKNFYRLIRDVEFSGYDFVAFSDQDDIWLPKKLFHATSMINKQNIDALSSDVIAFWDDGREQLVKKSFDQKKYDYLFEAAGPGCTYVFSAAGLEVFKSFLEANWEGVNKVGLHDWMLYAFYRKHKLKWLIDDTPLMRYRQHASNQVGFNSGIKAYQKRLKLVKDKWYRHEVEKITHLVGSTMPSRWFCIKNFWHLRRRSRDAFALLMMNLLGIF